MKCQILKNENNMVTIEMIIPSDEFSDAIKKTYLKDKAKFSIQGFRKGKAPQKMIEMNYGKEVFYDGAIDLVLPKAYTTALDELNLEPVSKPDVEIKQIEQGKDLVVEATFAVKPEIEVKGYKGVEIEAVKTVITDEDIQKELEKEQNLNGRVITVEDRPIKNGDTAVIDFEGFVDGEPFEGGKGYDHDLVIGSGSFIPGFEEQLIGKEVDDEVDVNVTFPEQYHAPELAGKDAVFKVKIHGIMSRELPELDDEFAKDTSEFDTLDELKEDIKKRLEKDAAKRDEDTLKNNLLDKVIELNEIEIPEPMVDAEIDGMIEDMRQQLKYQYQGMELEQYFQLTGTTLEQMREGARDDARQRVKANLVIESVVKQEKIEATDDDLQKEFEKIAEMQNRELDEIKQLLAMQVDYIKTTIESRKAVDFIVENAKLK